MANNIERLNYYEREYLRSSDFIAEQNYHLEMRRRLNLSLHLWGIVEGLDVKAGDVIPGVPQQYYISPGMAIDAYGREIFLFEPYMLSEEDVSRNRINLPGRYSVFIAYASELATPPAAGFRLCDLDDQYTRRHESYQIIISNQLDDSVDPKKVPGPSATDELSDDPVKKPWPVRLGSLDVAADLTISNAWPKNRTYIGLRAQRILAPVASLGDSAPDANRPISVEADLRPRKNLIVGKDFEVLKADVTPAPTISPFPSKKGNLKVRHDLFMRGEFYKQVDTKWLDLGEYIKSLVPDVLVGEQPLNVPVNSPGGPVNGILTFPVNSGRLKKIGGAIGTASIKKIQWNTRSELAAIVANTDDIRIEINAVTVNSRTPADNGCDVEVSWSLRPTLNAPTFRSAITNATISYVIVCYPE
jgi:hypothetical protein